MHGVAPPLSSSRERRHTDSDIARPKAEWPPGYQPFVKPVIPSDYLANLHRNPASEYGGPPSTATSLRSTVIDLPHSSFPSPRLSAKLSRKRAHSNTPSSVESIDLNALIRGSPDSLSGYLGPARVSSAGSFGHLSPIGFCTSPGSHQASCYPVARTVFITPPPIATPRIPTPSSTSRDALPSSTTGAEGTKEEMSESMSCAESSQVSRAKEPQGTSCKEESMDVCPLDSTTSPGASEVKQEGSDNEGEENQGEQDQERDLTCHWKECQKLFETQDDLVKHVNTDHIKKDRKDFTCYWDGCTREKKPFKAQYMLVVHMRRHTGEKPHKCTYEGCNKAYSRLENLKTHLRSHTGERPYVCEVEGCNKAFSNASDRAKHQNRTHSSVKPYVCKVPGCPKRYTDPSSLRKHTKTVHGEQGIKRLKAEGSREKPQPNSDKKGNLSSDKGQGSNTSSSGTQASQPMSNHVEEPMSPGQDGSSSAGSVIQAGSCSQTIVGSSFDGDVVSSSCERTPGGLDIPSSRESPRNMGNSMLGVSPRSPPFVSQLPDIIEGDWEPGENGAVTTAQEVRPPAPSVNLPKIDVHKRDVAQWVSDVHRRMSQTSRRSSDGSHLSVELGDASRRSSQESGWSSYGSHRSSLASPFPTTNIQPQEVIPHYPSGCPPPVPTGMTPLHCRPNLHPFDSSDDTLRRTSETSTCSNQSAPYNRLSRNSSGYGSQSNLAVIRSPIFHKIPPSSRLLPQRNNCNNAANRRKSDTVICEADSSGGYLPQNGKSELRRSSEPIRQSRAHMSRPEPLNGTVNRQVMPMPNVNETELICGDVDPQEFDAYLNGQGQGQLEPTPPLHPPPVRQVMSVSQPHQTQRLRHYPYPEEQEAAQQPHQLSLQTVHHRPQPCLQRNSQQVQWPQSSYRSEQLLSVPDVSGGFYPASENAAYSTSGEQTPAQKTQCDMANHEIDAMVSGMGLLSTENGGVSEFVGNGNMVVNDMNTLLNSLREEERYLEMCQNSRGQATGSAMSIF